MNHREALDLHAAERYCLGELGTLEREHFEEHYFLCARCAVEVKRFFQMGTALQAVLPEFTAALVKKNP